MAKVIKRVALKTFQHSQRCLITLKTRLVGGKIWLEAQSKVVQTDPLEGSQFIGIRILDLKGCVAEQKKEFLDENKLQKCFLL